MAQTGFRERKSPSQVSLIILSATYSYSYILTPASTTGFTVAKPRGDKWYLLLYKLNPLLRGVDRGMQIRGFFWPNPSIRQYFCSNLKPQPHLETEEQKLKSKLASVTAIVNVAQTVWQRRQHA